MKKRCVRCGKELKPGEYRVGYYLAQSDYLVPGRYKGDAVHRSKARCKP